MNNYSVEVKPTLIDPDGTKSVHGGKHESSNPRECVHLTINMYSNGDCIGNCTYEQLIAAVSSSDVHVSGQVLGEHMNEDSELCMIAATVKYIEYNYDKEYFRIVTEVLDDIYIGKPNVYSLNLGDAVIK